MRHLLWVACSVGDGRRASGHRGEQGKLLHAQLVHHSIQVEQMRLQGVVGHFTVREARPSSVIPDEHSLPCKALAHRTPVIGLPLQLDVAEVNPWHVDKAHALPQRPEGDAHAVARLRVLDAWLHSGDYSTASEPSQPGGAARCAPGRGKRRPYSRSGQSPSNTNSAGPVRNTSPLPSHSTVSKPPGCVMSSLSPANPFSRAATIAALLPLPQASVSPTPRSHTRSSIRSRPSILATPKFTRAGNAGWRSTFGPKSSSGYAATGVSMNSTACGFPIERQVTASDRPSTPSRMSITGGSAAVSTGTSRGANRGAPIERRTRSTRPPSPNSSASSTPDAASTRRRPSRGRARPRPVPYFTRQRTPLPLTSASDPSALNSRILTSAACEASTSIRPSAPTP